MTQTRNNVFYIDDATTQSASLHTLTSGRSSYPTEQYLLLMLFGTLQLDVYAYYQHL